MTTASGCHCNLRTGNFLPSNCQLCWVSGHWLTLCHRLLRARCRRSRVTANRRALSERFTSPTDSDRQCAVIQTVRQKALVLCVGKVTVTGCKRSLVARRGRSNGTRVKIFSVIGQVNGLGAAAMKVELREHKPGYGVVQRVVCSPILPALYQVRVTVLKRCHIQPPGLRPSGPGLPAPNVGQFACADRSGICRGSD